MEITVECQKRPEGSKPKALRRAGLIPANLYGHKGAESVSLTVNAKTAETLLKKAVVNNTLIDLNIPDLSWSGKALIREVQAHPWKNELYHLSFFSVGTHDTVEVLVPLKLVGQAVGVKKGGILEHPFTELQVKCSPDHIPDSIEVDMSNLDWGSSFHIRDLVLPPGIAVMDDPEQTLLSIVPPASGTGETAEELAEA